MGDRTPITLQQAVDHLYQTAVAENKSTSTLRLKVLADYCIQELASRGLKDACAEATIPAGGRDKDWDVAWKWAGKYRLVLSLKSILKNLAGTVPNRIDDAMGETASIQLYSPEIVTGYIMLFNTAADKFSQKHGSTWIELLSKRLGTLSGRRAPYWSPGTFEAYSVVEIDFSTQPKLCGGEEMLATMFDELVEEVKRRNPGIGESA